MTCGKHPDSGHKTHLCASCGRLSIECESNCRQAGACHFIDCGAAVEAMA
ncbi:MAG: hypothetical protein PHH85_01570 [Candidatus Methanoperedens sp.]|nr:hypothetical protein [Candidatus Methanoperedens sp.]